MRTTRPSRRSRSTAAPTETWASAAMQGRSTMRRARRCRTWRVFIATRPAELDVAEAGQVLDLGERQQPRQPLAPELLLQLVQRLLLRPGPVVGGAQVVDGELGQADLQRRRVGQRAGGVGAQPLAGPGVAGQLGAVLAVGVDEQEAVAAGGAQHVAGQHHHQVRLAHARGGEDADVAGQAPAGDADLEVDGLLAAAQGADGQVAHAGAQEVEVGGLGLDHLGELGGQALGPAEVGAVGGQVAEAAAGRHPVGPPGLVVEAVQAGLAPGVVDQQRARHPLGPPRLPVLGAVGHVDDAEQVAPAGGLVDRHQQLAQEQVLVRRGPEHPFEHVLPEQPPGAHQNRSIRSWRSAKARSRTSAGTPARSSSSSSSYQVSWRSQPGQAARRSATVSGYG